MHDAGGGAQQAQQGGDEMRAGNMRDWGRKREEMWTTGERGNRWGDCRRRGKRHGMLEKEDSRERMWATGEEVSALLDKSAFTGTFSRSIRNQKKR
ncbi:hypothetical protein ABZP36_030268 [Zizania latifolia]